VPLPRVTILVRAPSCFRSARPWLTIGQSRCHRRMRRLLTQITLSDAISTDEASASVLLAEDFEEGLDLTHRWALTSTDGEDKLSLAYDRFAGVVRWIINDRGSARVDRIGFPSADTPKARPCSARARRCGSASSKSDAARQDPAMALTAATSSCEAASNGRRYERDRPECPAERSWLHGVPGGRVAGLVAAPSGEFFEGPALAPPDSHPADQPVPGPAGAVPSDWQLHLHCVGLRLRALADFRF
jgi:hypothetical protein